MAAISDYLEDELIEHVFRGGALPAIPNIWLALFTTDPKDTDVGVEVAGGSYARQQITGGTAFTVPVNGRSENGGVITFPTATAGWTTVTHAGIYDAVGGGNLLFHAKLTTARTVNLGDTFSVGAGELVVRFS